VFREERHAHVSGQIEVRRIRHVTIEVHGSPAREELSGVPITEVCGHGRKLDRSAGAADDGNP
jgi:hypothetical protein